LREWRPGLVLVLLVLAISAVSACRGNTEQGPTGADGRLAGTGDRDLLAASALRVFVLSDSGGVHRTELSQGKIVLVSSDVNIRFPGDSLANQDSLTVAALPSADRTYFVLRSGPELQRRRLCGPVDYIRIESIDIGPAEATVLILVCHMPAGREGYLASEDGDILRFRRDAAGWKYVGVDCTVTS